ncbi:hypothetical protein VTL71DRAFT_6587 [Oculimacula yallundae]|uniref:Protein kinase domain-containing protein n=1 Tax=Oculimacula yallundae TaxID=86028 RepID=A0ABR4BXE2_9HELO
MTPKRNYTNETSPRGSPGKKQKTLLMPGALPPGRKLESKPPKKVRFIPTNEEILAMSQPQRRQFRHEEWLKRSVSWDGLTPPGGGRWKAVKVLGQGTYGIAGLFKYEGPNKSIPQSIVCKQCGPRDRHALIRESRILAELATAGSSHIIKLIKSVFYAVGTGVHPLWDPIPYVRTERGKDKPIDTYNEELQVSKIYLEHCEEGDLFHYQEKINPQNKYPSEESLWRLLECYVRGLCVLATGHEGFVPDAPEIVAPEPALSDDAAVSIPDVPGTNASDSSSQNGGSEMGVKDPPNVQPINVGKDVGGLKGLANATLEVLIFSLSIFAIGNPNVLSPDSPPIGPVVVDPVATAPQPQVKAQPVIPWRPIVHFDVKPDNLFVGNADADHQDPRRVVHKFGDFGMARHYPKKMTQEFMLYGQFCGAAGIKPPEQMYRGVQNADIGMPGDLWCVAATIYVLIVGKYIPPSKHRVTFTVAKGQSETYETQGADLLCLSTHLYSNTLLNLLMRCLAFDVTKRPSLAALKTTIDGAIAALDSDNNAIGQAYFDFTRNNLEYHADPANSRLPGPPAIRENFTSMGSRKFDNPRLDLGARIDLLGFAPAGAPSNVIGGNTAGYSVRPANFEAILSTPMLKEQQQKMQDDADIAEFNLDS